MKKCYFCNCVSPDRSVFKDVNSLSDIVDDATEIRQDEFLQNCEVDEEILKQILAFPNDFSFYRNDEIYFFTHSAVEHFFMLL